MIPVIFKKYVSKGIIKIFNVFMLVQKANETIIKANIDKKSASEKLSLFFLKGNIWSKGFLGVHYALRLTPVDSIYIIFLTVL